MYKTSPVLVLCRCGGCWGLLGGGEAVGVVHGPLEPHILGRPGQPGQVGRAACNWLMVNLTELHHDKWLSLYCCTRGSRYYYAWKFLVFTIPEFVMMAIRWYSLWLAYLRNYYFIYYYSCASALMVTAQPLQVVA